MNKTLGTIVAILCVPTWALGAIGGVGYLLHFGKPLFAIAVGGLAVISAPKVLELIKKYLLG